MTRITRQLVPIAFTLGAVVALAAPLLPLASEAIAGTCHVEEETVVSIQPKGESETTTVSLPDMKPGETRTIPSESGKDVTVTRTDSGYRLRIGDRDFNIVTTVSEGPGHVMLLREGGEKSLSFTVEPDSNDILLEKHPGEEKASSPMRKRRLVVIGEGGPDVTFTPNVKELLAKQDLSALKGVDERTRETVEKALEELLEKGALSVGKRRMAFLGTPGDGDRIEIRVQKKVTDEQ